MNMDTIATEFTNFYYQTFDSNRAQLASLYVRFSFSPPADSLLPSCEADTSSPYLYAHTFHPRTAPQRPNSMLTFEGQPFQGTESIVEKLVSLPFQKVAHQVATRDVQPTGSDQSSLFVLVTGHLVVDDGEHPMSYTQAFTLAPDGAGSFYVYNDCFRLNLG
ncbi:hypothetical protein A4X09_0g6940 [Tilletia walkeri]|uniref:Nuclear transport factor 2 n=1 Tax=Tilletia walkeri TaxID=117179 RepID=A0A8X7T1W3_9BASI|nr:hypothetical protein A4X09_0g6940 [Tilletia walkeri]